MKFIGDSAVAAPDANRSFVPHFQQNWRVSAFRVVQFWQWIMPKNP